MKSFRHIFQKCLLTLFIFGIFCTSSIRPIFYSYAATAQTYYIQSTVDTSSWTIVAAAVADKNPVKGNYTEIERIGIKLLEDMKTSSPSNMSSSALSAEIPSPDHGQGGILGDETRTNGESNKVLSFPGFQTQSGLSTPSATSAMLNRAIFVKDKLVNDYNTAMYMVYEGKRWANIEDYYKDAKKLIDAAATGGTVGNYTITRCSDGDSGVKDLINNADGIDANCYIKITSTNGQGKPVYLLTSIEKYTEASLVGTQKTDRVEDYDTKYVNWSMFLIEACINATLEKPVTASSVYNATSVSSLEKNVTSLFNNLLNGLIGILGLWGYDELIFNRGIRGSGGYIYGIFPQTWETFIWTLFLIMEFISFAIIMVAIIKHIMNKAASTVNPAIRMSAMEQVKDMMIGILILTALPGILIAMMRLSYSLVNIFDSMVSDLSITEQLGNYQTGTAFASVIVGFANLIISIYFNWYYIIRQITVALLFCISPIFVCIIMLGSDKRPIAMRWAMELISNIFIQPIHAMLFSFFVLIPYSGRAIESLIMLYSLIPLSALLKGLFFPGVNDFANRMSGGAGKTAGNLGKKAGMLAVGGAVAGGIAAGKAIGATAKSAKMGGGSTGGTGNSSGVGSVLSKSNSSAVSGVAGGAAKSTPASGISNTKKSIANGAGDIGENKGTNNSVATATASGNSTNSSSSTNSGSTSGASGASSGGVTGGSAPQSSYDTSTSRENATQETTQPNIPENTTQNPFSTKDDVSDSGTNSQISNSQQKAEKTQATGSSAGTFKRGSNFATAFAGARYVAGSAFTGAVRGWKGQIISRGLTSPADRENYNRFTSRLNASTDATNTTDTSSVGSSTPTGSSGDYSSTSGQTINGNSAGMSIPYENIGDSKMTDMSAANDSGFNRIQSYKDNGEQQVSYTVSKDSLNEEDRQTMAAISTDGPDRDMAMKAGYRVDSIKNQAGEDTGKYRVSVGKNNYTGASAPSIQGKDIIHGGSRNDMIPNINTIRSQAANPVVQEQPVINNRGRNREPSESPKSSGGRRSNRGNRESPNRSSNTPPPNPQPSAPQPTPSQFEEAAQAPVRPHESISNNSSDPNSNDGNTDITYQARTHDYGQMGNHDRKKTSSPDINDYEQSIETDSSLNQGQEQLYSDDDGQIIATE